MNEIEWKRKITDVFERLKTRYDHIGSKTGVRFLAVVYPPEVQEAFFNDWETHAAAEKTELDITNIKVLDITQIVISDLGVDNIIDSIDNPLPGSDPEDDLGNLWIKSIVDEVYKAFEESSHSKPVVCLSQLAALHPAASPRQLMQAIWNIDQINLKGPVILFIPGSLAGPRKYSFLDIKDEFMYRGDLM